MDGVDIGCFERVWLHLEALALHTIPMSDAIEVLDDNFLNSYLIISPAKLTLHFPKITRQPHTTIQQQ
jgi:hypothetical protein